MIKGQPASESPENEPRDDDAERALGSLIYSSSEGFHRQRIEIAPASAIMYDEHQWVGALVVVERGEIELVCTDGHSSTFQRGAMLVLSGLPLRAVRNAGSETASIVSIRRSKTEGRKTQRG